jgi:hypothetical protein
MAGNDLVAARRQFAFCDMQVRSTDAACSHANEKVARCELRLRNLADFKRTLQDIARRNEDSGFHSDIGFYSYAASPS